jgi:hypothetical protein
MSEYHVPPPYPGGPSQPGPYPGYVSTGMPQQGAYPGYVSTGMPQQGAYPGYVSTGAPHDMGNVVIVSGGGPCPHCHIGYPRDDYNVCGICLAIFFFPIGILCCLAIKDRTCSNCGRNL